MTQQARTPTEPDGTLRLIWPQWQGAGTESVEHFAPEFPFSVARRGYAVGSTVLAAVLPPHHQGPTATVPPEDPYGRWGASAVRLLRLQQT